jgi:ankyrin repeat protein
MSREMTFDEAHRLIKHGQAEVLRNAIPATLSPNAGSAGGWTLLMLAAWKGNSPICRLLLDRGADIATTNASGESALSLAVCAGHLAVVKLLKSNGASPDVRPYGHELADWLKVSSGLSADRIAATLSALR